MTPSQIESAKFLINKAMPNPPEQKDVNLAGQLTVNVKHYGGNRSAE